MAIDTNDVMLKKSRNLRGVKKVEARDVASPNFPLEGNYYDRDPSGNLGIGGKLGSNTQYTMRWKFLLRDAHLWRNQRCESSEFRCLHSSDVGLGMLFWILSVSPRISQDFFGNFKSSYGTVSYWFLTQFIDPNKLC